MFCSVVGLLFSSVFRTSTKFQTWNIHTHTHTINQKKKLNLEHIIVPNSAFRYALCTRKTRNIKLLWFIIILCVLFFRLRQQTTARFILITCFFFATIRNWKDNNEKKTERDIFRFTKRIISTFPASQNTSVVVAYSKFKLYNLLAWGSWNEVVCIYFKCVWKSLSMRKQQINEIVECTSFFFYFVLLLISTHYELCWHECVSLKAAEKEGRKKNNRIKKMLCLEPITTCFVRYFLSNGCDSHLTL